MEDIGPYSIAPAQMKYTAIIHGERVEVELNRASDVPGRIEARIGGRTYVVEGQEVEPGLYSFIRENRSFEIAVIESAEGYVVSIGRSRVPIEIVDSRTALRRAVHHGQDGAIEIRAPMPGKIVKVLVTENAEVEANQGLVVIEAMKMQNEIKSPKKGTVRKLAVSEGAAVSAGDLLAAIE